MLEKATIRSAYAPAIGVAQGIALGDDCAAIPEPAEGGHLLFAAEGMLPGFVEKDPWFAGYSAVMVNLSDIAAMGGRPIAITDVLWSPDDGVSEQVWEGMRAASEAYGVPIVGGHTTRVAEGQPAGLAAAVLGRAGERLITSFDARPGERLAIAIDMAGEFRHGKPYWNASTSTGPERLRAELELPVRLVEAGLCRAGKDISNGGIVGTLAMLCECSGVAVVIDLDALPVPPGVAWERWLISFPSYGYLFAIAEGDLAEVAGVFAGSGITFAEFGSIRQGAGVFLSSGDAECEVAFG